MNNVHLRTNLCSHPGTISFLFHHPSFGIHSLVFRLLRRSAAVTNVEHYETFIYAPVKQQGCLSPSETISKTREGAVGQKHQSPETREESELSLHQDPTIEPNVHMGAIKRHIIPTRANLHLTRMCIYHARHCAWEGQVCAETDRRCSIAPGHKAHICHSCH